MQNLSITLLVMLTLNSACGDPPSVDDTDAHGADAGVVIPGPPPDPTPPVTASVRVSSYCVRSSCTGCTDRQQIAIDSCYDCIEFCGMNPPSSSCISTCQGICARANAMTCVAECNAPTCYDSNVAFSLVGAADESIRAACVAGNTTCAEPSAIDELCDVAAKVEPRSVLDTYRCLGTKACTLEAQASCIPAATGSLRTWYCAALVSEGGACTGSEVEQALDGVEPWLRADVMSSVKACTTELGAADFTACVVRWLHVVGG